MTPEENQNAQAAPDPNVLPAALAHQEREKPDIQPQPAPGDAPAPAAADPWSIQTHAAPADCLWTVQECAAFLRKSRRWLFLQLRLPDDAAGSVPHVKLGRTPRFIPDDLKAWASMGFPPVSTFRQWQQSEHRRKKTA